MQKTFSPRGNEKNISRCHNGGSNEEKNYNDIENESMEFS